MELLSFWGEKMHLSFLQSFSVLAALSFFVETERNDESISTILHSPLGKKHNGPLLVEPPKTTFFLQVAYYFWNVVFFIGGI